MVPVKKTSKTRTRTRRSHHALTAVNYAVCPNCSDSKLPHSACGNCGFVNSKLTLDIASEDSE